MCALAAVSAVSSVQCEYTCAQGAYEVLLSGPNASETEGVVFASKISILAKNEEQNIYMERENRKILAFSNPGNVAEAWIAENLLPSGEIFKYPSITLHN